MEAASFGSKRSKATRWAPTTNEVIRNAHRVAFDRFDPKDAASIASRFTGSLRVVYKGHITSTLQSLVKDYTGLYSIIQLAFALEAHDNPTLPVPSTTLVSADDSPDR